MRDMRSDVTAIFAFTIVVAGCQGKNPSGPSYEVHCTEPVPTFGRSSRVSRTPELDAKLCKCIWATLEGTDRLTAEKMSKGQWNQISSLDADSFKSHFGKIAVDCGP
jgi:hypothetical protein